jgi:hypothetical protein
MEKAANGTGAGASDTARKAPLHLWIVGILSLLWNCVGAYDYTMTNLRDPGYLAKFPPEVLGMLDAMPVWAHAAWAVGVWGALLGSILLLLRSRHAFTAFVLSVAGLAVSTVAQQITGLPDTMKTDGMLAMSVAIWVIAIALVFYSRRMQGEGVLR